ncbi:MAG: ATP-dependent helicase [Opitutales bacterium]
MSLSPIDFRAELNEEQHAAVTAPDGPALVLAGAGSGKTRTLTYRVAYLMLERGIDSRNLLLLTFTNKAAREMVERVLELTASAYPPAWGGTFHSIGGRILRSHGEKVGLAPNYTILDEGDATGLLTQVIKDADKAYLKNKDNPKPKLIANLISYARNTCVGVEDHARVAIGWSEELPAQIGSFARLYEARKREMKVADYDDLLVLWLQLLREHEDVRNFYAEKFRHVLVDEYQDTNSLQSEIIDLLAPHHNIMAVGDDAQCIYTWRGANFENIRSFPERHPATTIYKIVRNYRSTPEILALANSVLAAQPVGMGYDKELVADRDHSTLPYVVPVMDSRQQADFLISRIEALYEEGYRLGDIAILYRAHYQALDAQLEFTRRGIPFIITSGLKFFEQAHVRDYVAQLRFVSNPDDLPALERVLCLLPKVGPATVRKLLKEAQKLRSKALGEQRSQGGDLFVPKDSENDATRLVGALGAESVVAKVPVDAREDYVSLIATLQELDSLLRESMSGDDANGETPAGIVERGIEGWYGDYLRTVYPDADRRREDLAGLVAFAERYSTMAELLAQLVLLNSETNEKGIDISDDNAVRMTTVHQAKGLEFPVVFVLSCADELFPLRRAIEEGDVEEERRLFYVAVTRAMDELYLTIPFLNSGRGGGSLRLEPSRFITELPPDRYERLGFRPTRY